MKSRFMGIFVSVVATSILGMGFAFASTPEGTIQINEYTCKNTVFDYELILKGGDPNGDDCSESITDGRRRPKRMSWTVRAPALKFEQYR
ncbi:MAG: hypothetical protein AABY34_06185 [Pseudomonadota bacterium]